MLQTDYTSGNGGNVKILMREVVVVNEVDIVHVQRCIFSGRDAWSSASSRRSIIVSVVAIATSSPVSGSSVNLRFYRKALLESNLVLYSY